MLEQHLPLGILGRIQLERQRHLQAGQIQGKGRHVAHRPASGILQEHAHLGAIGGHHAQTVPARHRQVLANQLDKLAIQLGKRQMRKLMARLGKGLRTDVTGQIGLIGEVRKKSVEFILNTGFETGNHADQQHGKGQFAGSDEGVVVKTGLFE